MQTDENCDARKYDNALFRIRKVCNCNYKIRYDMHRVSCKCNSKLTYARCI